MAHMLFYGLIAGLICCLWLAVLLRKTGLLGACMLTLVAGTCFGHAFFHADLGPLPITSDRLLVGFLCIGYLVYRRFQPLDEPRLDRTDVVVLVFAALLCLSTFLNNWKLDGLQPVATLLFFFLLPVPVYWVMRGIRLGEQQIRAIFLCLGCFGLYLAATAVCEKLEIYALIFPRYIIDGSYAEFYGRGRGPLLNPIGNGLLITLALFSVLMLWPTATRVQQLAIAAATPIYLAGAYCTMTRSVWLGMVGGLFVMVLFNTPRRFRPGLAYATIVCGLVGLLVLSDSLNSFKRDKDVSVADMKKSAGLRPVLATVAWKMFQDRPFLGVGLGQYRAESIYYLNDRNTPLRLEAARPYVQHNVFLAMLTENGAFGLGLFVLLLGLMAVNAWRIWRDDQETLARRQVGLLVLAYLIAYAVNGMFHDLCVIQMMNMFLFFLAGLLRNVAVARIGVPTIAPTTVNRIARVHGT